MRYRNQNDWFRNLDLDPSDWFTPRRNESSEVLGSLAVFSAGLLVGIGAALMLAPKPGAELRQDFARSAGKLGDQLRETIPGLPDRDGATNDEMASSHAS